MSRLQAREGRAAGNQVLTDDKEGMDSRWILEPGDALGRALVVMVIKGGVEGGWWWWSGWELRTLIKDGVFTSHQVPVVPSVAGAEACRNGARGEGASTNRGRACRLPLKLTVSQSARPSNAHLRFRSQPALPTSSFLRPPPTWLPRRASSSSTCLTAMTRQPPDTSPQRSLHDGG